METETIVFCERCGARCRCDGSSNPKAKMLRRSKEPKGLCVNCAVHDWMRNTYPVNMILANGGPKILYHLHIREQFSEIMRAGGADANPDEINWNLINENWDLPFPHKIKPSATNPCTQKELDEIKAGKRTSFLAGSRPSVCEIAKMPVCKTFEDLNKLEHGLGDNLKNLLTDSKEKIMSKKSSMQEQVEKDEKGEQIPLMEVGPENLNDIVEAVKIYKGYQKDRMTALKLEMKWRDKIKALVKQAELQPLKDGKIKFTHGKVTICITPRDELITITEAKPKKPKKSKKAKKGKKQNG